MREINQFPECQPLNRFTDLLQDGKTRHNGKLIGILAAPDTFFVTTCFYLPFPVASKLAPEP